VFVNTPDERIVRGRPHPINSGDRILIDPYSIEVQITADARPASAVRPALDNPFLAPEEEAFADGSFAPVPVDPLDALNLHTDKPAPPKGPSSPELAGGSPLWSHYTPPAVEPEQPEELIPANWLDSSVSFVPAASAGKPRPPTPAPTPPPAAAEPVHRDTPPAHDNPLTSVLRAAGLAHATASPELASDLGKIFRVVVSGVMDVLKARQQTKDQFGLGMTTFKRADNNPLKFSADVDDALHNLFVKQQNTTYLGPVDAFEDAFDDMRNHQIAMLVGVRVAFEAMLSEFHPDHLQEMFDRQVKKGALVSMPARLRYWELYREWIHDMVRDADTSFRELFGDEFARAYEEQLRRLKAQGRDGSANEKEKR
jgi:type VI secretion system FHA domain protein